MHKKVQTEIKESFIAHEVSDLMTQKTCTLLLIGLDTNVPVYPPKGCIYALLTSPELMNSKFGFQRSTKSFLCTSLEI